ncbi:chitinase, putative, partial [Ixodes scapularis]
SGFEVVCRVVHESFHRQGVWIFGMEDVPACMCTQLVFGSVDNLRTGELHWSYLGNICKENLKKFKCFKRRYPHLKTFVELGHWDVREHLRKMAADPSKRRTFAANTVKFLLNFGLDGLSVFIGEEPFEVLSQSTKQNLAALLKELSAAFKPAGKLLSATFRGTENMQDFAKNIEPYVDFIYVLAIRMRQNDFGVTGMHTQLHPLPSDPEKYKAHNIETYIRTLAKVVPKHKLLAVLAFEGTAFRLASSDKPGFYDPSQPGLSAVYKGQYTKNPQAIGYFEFCRLYDYHTWHHDWNETFISTYVYSDKDWISYDDGRSVSARARWLVNEGVGGVVAWSIDKDDFRGICGSVYPMLESI